MMAYGVRVGGADEVEVHFLDVATRKETGDVMPRARYSGVDISPDKAGVYYSKLFPHEGNRVFYHKFGTPLDSDAMILGKEYRGEKLGEIDGVSVRATANGHYLVFRIGQRRAGDARGHSDQGPAGAGFADCAAGVWDRQPIWRVQRGRHVLCSDRLQGSEWAGAEGGAGQVTGRVAGDYSLRERMCWRR